jgi:hypothetical protein
MSDEVPSTDNDGSPYLDEPDGADGRENSNPYEGAGRRGITHDNRIDNRRYGGACGRRGIGSGRMNNDIKENILAVRSCKESIDKNMKVKSRLVLSLFVIFASVVITATLNNNSVDELFHVKITDLSVLIPLAISLISAFLVVRLASAPEKIENLFGQYKGSSYNILEGQLDNEKILKLEQEKTSRAKLIDELSSSILAVSLLTFIAGCFLLLLTAPEYNEKAGLILGASLFLLLSTLFFISAFFRCIKNNLFFNARKSLFGDSHTRKDIKNKLFLSKEKKLLTETESEDKSKKSEVEQYEIKKSKPRAKIWALLASIIFVVAGVGGCYIVVVDDDAEGIADTYTYKTKGLYDDGTRGYEGTWIVEFSNGEVKSSIMEIMPADASSIQGTTSLSISNPVYSRQSGYVDHLPDMNRMLKGTTFLGYEKIITLLHGKLDLRVYADGDTRYYVGEKGIIHRAILTVEIVGNDTDYIRVAFDLSSIGESSER